MCCVARPHKIDLPRTPTTSAGIVGLRPGTAVPPDDAHPNTPDPQHHRHHLAARARILAASVAYPTAFAMPAVRDHYNAIANMAPRQPALDVPAIVFAAPKTAPMAKRQNVIYTQQGIIPTYYNTSGPEPGTVVGIVLGSVAGFLLICWLIQSLMNTNNRTGTTTAMAGEEEIVVKRRRNSHGGRSSRRRSEVREISRSPRRNSGRSQIIVEERRQAAPRARSIIVEGRNRVPGDDVVEVIEEHEDYRERRGTRGGRGYR